MLEITIPKQELWDDVNEKFIDVKSQQLQLEHSLVSLSKWESKWKKPFLGKDKKTDEETIDYIRCMTITQNVNPDVYLFIPANAVKKIQDYIEDKMTATWFNEEEDAPGTSPKRKETITSEIIYYWMIAQNIPMECQKWHLNRLLTLIRVCSIKNTPPPKKGTKNKKSSAAQRKALNEARRKQLNSKG